MQVRYRYRIFDDLEAEQDRLEEILGGLDGAQWAESGLQASGPHGAAALRLLRTTPPDPAAACYLPRKARIAASSAAASCR